MPAQTKEEILDKCIGIFAENGIENTAVSVIAANADKSGNAL